MPLQKCGSGGWRWGNSGKCFTGKDAKKKAIIQGIAIEGAEEFAAEASKDEVKIAMECHVRNVPIHIKAQISSVCLNKNKIE